MAYINPIYSEILKTENALNSWKEEADNAAYYGHTENYLYALEQIAALKDSLSELRNQWEHSEETLVCSF